MDFYHSKPSESVFLLKLFEELNQRNIYYAVMRNYDSLPFGLDGSDLDIQIHKRDENLVRTIVIETIKDAGGVPIGCSETTGFFNIYALGHAPFVPYPWWGVCLDIYIGLYFRGQSLLAKDVSLPVHKHHGVAVLPVETANVLGVLKEVLNNGIIPTRYAGAARCAAIHNWPQIQYQLSPLGSEALGWLHALLLSDAAPENLRRECINLRKAFLRKAFTRSPVLYLSRLIKYQWAKVRRYLRPSGIVLAVLGVDGAGKSTVINAILPALQAATHNSVFVQHLRPTLLPPLARLKGKKNVAASPVLAPHSSQPSGTVVSFFRLFYLTLDYILGYWLKIRPKIAKQPAVILYDRYAYDMMLDPKRFRIGLSSRLTGWFASRAPKPDLIFCLQGDPQTFAERKNELSVNETTRQVEALLAFASQEPRAVLISTEMSIEETRDHVLTSLCEFLRTRQDRNAQ